LKKSLSLFKSVTAWLYIMFLAVQALSLSSAFIIKNEFTNDTALPFFRFWNILGGKIFENWLPFSIMYIAIFVGSILGSQLRARSYVGKRFLNTTLLCMNLILCNRLFDTSELQTRVEFITDNIWGVLGFVLSAIIVILVGYALKKAREAKKEQPNQPPTQINDNNPAPTNTHTEIPYSFSSRTEEERYMKRHPITYIWNSFKYYLSRKKQIKHLTKATYYEEKAKAKTEAKIRIYQKKYADKFNSYNPKQSIWIWIRDKMSNKDSAANASCNSEDDHIPHRERPSMVNIISGFLSIIIVIAVDVLFFIWLAKPDILPGSFLKTALESIKTFIIHGSNFLDNIETPVLNWFLVFGNALLIAIVFILIDFLLYFIARVLIYFIFSPKEDAAIIKRFSRQLKTFFFNMVDGVMRLLLFIPDFLELIEDFLLDTDIDKLVEDKFKDFDNTRVPKTPTPNTPPPQGNAPPNFTVTSHTSPNGTESEEE